MWIVRAAATTPSAVCMASLARLVPGGLANRLRAAVQWLVRLPPFLGAAAVSGAVLTAVLEHQHRHHLKLDQLFFIRTRRKHACEPSSSPSSPPSSPSLPSFPNSPPSSPTSPASPQVPFASPASDSSLASYSTCSANFSSSSTARSVYSSSIEFSIPQADSGSLTHAAVPSSQEPVQSFSSSSSLSSSSSSGHTNSSGSNSSHDSNEQAPANDDGDSSLLNALATFRELLSMTPLFEIHGSQVDVLGEPSDFYQRIKKGIAEAKERIILASLYLGTSSLEQQLVAELRNTLSRENSRVKVHLLFDCMRGTRGQPSSVDLLASLVRDFPDRVTISLYHTPALTGLWKRVLPERFNETLGVGHIKAYIFDDDIILSGANLSDSYFMDRLDRYMHFHQVPLITEYFGGLIGVLSKICFTFNPSSTNSSLIAPAITSADLTKDAESFRLAATKPLHDFMRQWHERTSNLRDLILGQRWAPSTQSDTIVALCLQMRHFNIDQDEKATLSFLRSAGRDPRSKLHITSGYFNFTEDYIRVLLEGRQTITMLAAAPKANGFFQSKGVSKHLPAAYTHIEKEFLLRVVEQKKDDQIQIKEYEREGWTYHAKGLWYYTPAETLPVVTTIGSPNFGHRSVDRDIEAQAYVFTGNRGLREAIHAGLLKLHQHAKQVTLETLNQEERKVASMVVLATKAVRGLL